MINTIIVLIITGILFYMSAKGPKYFDKLDRKAKAKERANNSYRWSNGRFAKEKTYADMRREVKANTIEDRKIPVYSAGLLESYISL